jgi:hypothetical protein
VEVDEKFLPGGYRKTDSVHIQLNNKEQLLRQANFNRLNGMFALSQEIINTYNIDNHLNYREYYFRNTLLEERTSTEYTYRCDGQLVEEKQTIIQKKPDTGLGNQSLSVYYYARNDACEDNTSKDLTIYPNPADQYVGVALPVGINSMHVKIINTFGQIVEEVALTTEFPYFRIDTSQLTEGLYIIQVLGEAESSAMRLVIDH